MKHVCLIAPLAFLMLTGCGRPEDGGEPEIGMTSNAIIGGEVDEGKDAHDAVVMLYNDAIGYTCSGTMIDRDVYLTAGHCIETTNPNDYYILGGTYNRVSDQPEWYRTAQSVQAHPSYNATNLTHDVGIVVLDQNAPVEPYRWLYVDTDDIYQVGTDFTAVGYGVSSAAGAGSGDGIRRRIDLSMTDIFSDVYEYGQAGANTCSGDSGGPGLKIIDGYYTVIGTVSFGDANCSQHGYDMRTDDNRTFIDDFADPDAGTAKPPKSGGSSSDNPFACSIGREARSQSPLGFAALALLLVISGAVVRRQHHA